ncbi:hypothetical protein [Bacillus sp. MUM 116]|uniref:hypothetical protein n=1 Tax=Bacillus sp. MUM 116 TaxID=1678002 RepID=UPI0015A6511D|nr:hypothetical protein [Bacillus sp. MUM 116]
MPQCQDCGNEETANYLVNGICEDCLEFHVISPDLDDEMDRTHFDPVRNLFPNME